MINSKDIIDYLIESGIIHEISEKELLDKDIEIGKVRFHNPAKSEIKLIKFILGVVLLGEEADMAEIKIIDGIINKAGDIEENTDLKDQYIELRLKEIDLPNVLGCSHLIFYLPKSLRIFLITNDDNHIIKYSYILNQPAYLINNE